MWSTGIHRERLDSCVTDVGLCTKVVLDLMKVSAIQDYSFTLTIFTLVLSYIIVFTSTWHKCMWYCTSQ